MRYSRWRPDGGFDYFETSERFNIGDDLPTPGLPSVAGGIGVPAQECGRPLPSNARRIGRGDLPNGILVPPPSGGAVGDVSIAGLTVSTPLLVFCGGALLGYLGYPWLRRQL